MIVFHSPHNSSAKHLIGIQISTHFDGSVLGHGVHVGAFLRKSCELDLFCVTINRIFFLKWHFKNLSFIGVLIYNVMFVSSVQQSDPGIV